MRSNVRSRKGSTNQSPLDEEALKLFLQRATEHHSAGRFDEAARLYEHVQARNPDALAAPYFLALMDVEFGRLESALDRLRHVTRHDPNSFEAQYSLAYVLQELGRWPQAIDAYRRAVALKPNVALSRLNLAAALEVMGRLDEAIAVLRELADQKHARLRAIIRIAQLKPAAITPEDFADLARTAENPDAPVGIRISSLFAMGEILEKQGRYDEAFAAFAEGNRLRRENISEPVEEEGVIAPPGARIVHDTPEAAARKHQMAVANISGRLTAPFIARHEGGGSASAAPIFVVGMPRSGSTLLEQILSSHPKVQGMGETTALGETLAGRFPYGNSETEETIAPDHFRRLADAYLERLRARGWRKEPFVIDKMLGNYMQIGVIHLMFPRATILHAMRDPVDTCLAGFRKLFRSGNETTYSLADIGAQYVRYREMMAHWDEVLPGRVVHVRHEALVSDPDSKIRWLVEEACRLKWDDACLRFYATRRPVRTASIAQVRQPIFTSSLERWRRYENHLGPLFEALGPYAPRG